MGISQSPRRQGAAKIRTAVGLTCHTPMNPVSIAAMNPVEALSAALAGTGVDTRLESGGRCLSGLIAVPNSVVTGAVQLMSPAAGLGIAQTALVNEMPEVGLANTFVPMRMKLASWPSLG